VTALGGGARGGLAAQAPEQALRAVRDPPVRHVERLGDVGGRRAVDEHRQQREVVGVDAVRGAVELRLVAVPDGTRVTVTEAPVGPFALVGA